MTTVEWLRDEAECALLDGCPVAAGRLQNAADEIERLEKRHDNFLKEFYATNAENAELQTRIKELEGVIRSQIDAWPELYAAIAATEQGENNPYGTDRSNCSECSATVYDNDDGLHFGECSQSRAPCIVERCGRLQMSDSEYCDKHYAENLTEQGENL